MPAVGLLSHQNCYGMLLAVSHKYGGEGAAYNAGGQTLVIRCQLLEGNGAMKAAGAELIEAWQPSGSAVLWVDICGEPDENVRQILDRLNCDPLSISDAFRLRHPPKVEEFDDNTFLLYRGVAAAVTGLDIPPMQVAIWVGSNYLVSFHRGPSVGVEHFWRDHGKGDSLREPGSFAMRLFHYEAGLYLQALLSFEDELEEIEDGLLTDHSEFNMKSLVAYRADLRRLKRVFSYHAVLANHVLEVGSPHLGLEEEKENHHLRRDLHDRCERLYSLCSMYYELCGDIVEGHISLSSHSLNKTMKILTIISAMFVPLTFLAGIYGMNFEYMPELSIRYAYFVLLGVMAVIMVSMLVVFRRIKWL